MAGPNSPEKQSGQESTQAEIMAATQRAIAKHGITDLSTQKIADEWGRSQPLLHYYYETKEELIVAYIDHLRASSNEAYEARASQTPLNRVWWMTQRDFDPADIDDQTSVSTALLELHAKAPHSEPYREALNRYEDDAREFLVTALQDGIERGTFREVDPEETATFLLSVLDGENLRTRMLGRSSDATTIRAGLEAYVRSNLLTETGRSEWSTLSENEV